MEKSLILKEKFFETFGLEEQDLRTYSPLTLAYIGDAIFELVVRTVLVERKNTQAEKLHKAATKIVKAENDPKQKMALVFRWYLGRSSRWAVMGEASRQLDMQIWCGQSMGAFNLWVNGTRFENPANRKVADIANLLLQSCAYHYMKSMLDMMGVDTAEWKNDLI